MEVLGLWCGVRPYGLQRRAVLQMARSVRECRVGQTLELQVLVGKRVRQRGNVTTASRADGYRALSLRLGRRKKSTAPIGLAYHQRGHLLDRRAVIAHANAASTTGIPAEGEEFGLQEKLVFFQFCKHNGPARPQSHVYTITLPVSVDPGIDFRRKEPRAARMELDLPERLGKGR